MVLLDIMMPVLGGVETAESLRAHLSTAHLPILGITGSTSHVERERMKRLCDALLLKPCAPEDILARIRSLVKGAN